MHHVLKLAGHLPLPILHALSTLTWLVAFYVVRWRRDLVTRNLQRAFPALTPAEIERLSRAHFRGLIDTAFETVKAATLSPEALTERVTFNHLDVLEGLGEKPYLLVSAHQGNWEWQLMALACVAPTPLEAVYAPSPVAAIDRFLTGIRTRFETKLIRPDDTLVEIGRRMKVPRGIVLLSDQNPRRDVERAWTRFLNQDTAFGVGLEKIARLTRYPVVFQSSRRVGRGRYEVSFELIGEPPYGKEGYALMQRYARVLEASIEQNPEDWLWSYDRWRYPKPIYG